MVLQDLEDRIEVALDRAERDEFLSSIGDRLATELDTGLGNLGQGLLNAFLDVIKYIGPAIIEGVARTYVVVRNVLEGHEVNTITAGTAVFLGTFAVIFLYNFAKSAGTNIPLTIVNR